VVTDRIYLDANASEMLRPQALEAAMTALGVPGNPASVHQQGRQARRVLEDARESIAACLGADPAGLVFTSGGTESDVLAIEALGMGRRLLIGATEHDAIRAAAPDAVVLPVHANGTLDLAALDTALAGQGVPALVCLMLANNETGVLHPVAEAAAVCRRHGALLHVDAVQAAGRIPVSLRELGADSLAVSGHKLGGPKGAGALLLAATVDGFRLTPSIAGGGQERGRRGGTPPLPAIAGFAAACAAACAELESQHRLRALRDRIERAAREHGAVPCGADAPRLANTACLALPGRRAELQLIALDLAGFAVSAGAACSSGKVSRSHVLDAMGLPSLAGASIRVSLPWTVRDEEVDRFIAAYAAMAAAGPGRGSERAA
jgi:cysteine desulfurase